MNLLSPGGLRALSIHGAVPWLISTVSRSGSVTLSFLGIGELVLLRDGMASNLWLNLYDTVSLESIYHGSDPFSPSVSRIGQRVY